jgi:hypothetical protein
VTHRLRSTIMPTPAVAGGLALLLAIRPVAAQKDSTCWPGSVTISPDVAISDAATRAQTISGSSSILVWHKATATCGAISNQFDILATNKYDSKQKDGGVANITRHNVGLLREMVTLPNGVSGVGASLQLLSDNSMGLYLQQTYSVVYTQALAWSEVPIEITGGASLVSRHYTASAALPPIVFAAPAIGGTFNYTVALGWTKPKATDNGTTAGAGTGAATASQAEFTFSTWNVLGPDSQRRQSSSSAALGIPTIVSGLSLTVKAAFDYVGNPPLGLKNRYFSIDVGPKLSLSRGK